MERHPAHNLKLQLATFFPRDTVAKAGTPKLVSFLGAGDAIHQVLAEIGGCLLLVVGKWLSNSAWLVLVVIAVILEGPPLALAIS